MKKKNSFSFYLNIILGLACCVLMLLNHWKAEDLKTSQMELDSARDSLNTYMLKYNKLRLQNSLMENMPKEQ